MLDLRAVEITKSYPLAGQRDASVQAIERVSLHYSSDEVLCVVGPNGSGKSTLLRMLAGVEAPDSGHIEVARLSSGEQPRVGLLLQDLGLFDWKTVRKHLDFGFMCGGFNSQTWREREKTILAQMGLEAHANKFPSELSGGLRQRCAIGRLLAYGAEILLLDEPFSAIDPSGRIELNAMLEGLWGRGERGLIVVTHDLEDATLLADRVIAIQGGPGRIVGEVKVSLPHPRRPALRFTPEFRDSLSAVEKLVGIETLGV